MSEKEKKDLLITRYLDGCISAEDSIVLHRWIESNNDHLQYFVEIKKIWDNCNMLGNTPEEMELALTRFRKNFQTPSVPVRTARSWLYRVAAFILFGIVTFALTMYLGKNNTPQFDSTQHLVNKIIIPKGQKGQLVLTDGTKVWLNSESILEYPGIFEQNREVSLVGEAYFEVKSNAARPFFVQTPKLKIKVTGTSFNIKAYEEDDKVETTLIKGRLSILKNDRELVVLQPNESAVYSRVENSLDITNLTKKIKALPGKKNPTKNNVTGHISPIELVGVWKEDKLIFQDELLGSMVKKLERWFNRKIHVSDPELLASEFNGKFVYHETIYQVLDAICRSSADLKYHEVNHEFYISKK